MEKQSKEWDRVIEELSTGMDLSRPEGREAAYAECIQYAEKQMAGDLKCNLFLAHAAAKLGASQVMRDVVREMVPLSDQALLHLGYDPVEGPVITGNREGLQYLSNLLKVLSQAPMLGEHAHLFWDEAPFYGETSGLAVYLEDDDWFVDSAFDYANGEEDSVSLRREISGDRVMAVQFLYPLSSSLRVSPSKIYVVQETVKQCGDEVWQKPIREDNSRMWVFTIRDDQGRSLRVGLDLDDPEINFLGRDDLAQFLH